ncbi:MAG: hypothetical protein IKG14_03075 [Clostridia bacterium]|nr:hypothetical protein [Clostridia bacterium]
MKSFKRKDNLKEAGITLVALVVTIIILLILAGVAISLALGNNGIIGRAQYASNTWANATKDEKIAMAGAENDIDILTEGFTNKESNSTEINHEVYDQLEIGSYIYYRPSGEYNWQAKYYASDSSYADKKLATGDRYSTLLEDENFDDDLIDMTVSVWRVFSKDDSTGEIKVIPAEMNTNYIPLVGAQGYNNGVKLLNDACSDLFKDTSKGITARSIKIEDLKDVMSEEALNKAQYSPYNSVEEVELYSGQYGHEPAYGTTWNTEQEGDRNSEGAFIYGYKYPVIYGQEAGRKINGIYTVDGLKQSEQNVFIEKNEGTSATNSIGLITTASNIQPKQTRQNLDIGSPYEGLEDYSPWSAMLEGCNIWSGIWVATRVVHLDDSGDRANFGLADLWQGDNSNAYAGTRNLIDSVGYEAYNDGGSQILPIVSMDSNLISLDQEAEIHYIANY